MSIEKITDRILSEANAESGRTLERADREKQAVLEKAALQADAIRKDAAEKADFEAVLIKERKIAVAELEARKLRLAEKQKAIESCFVRALEHLATMDQDAYVDMLLAALVKTGVSGGELLLNPFDRERLGDKLVERANEALRQTVDAEGATPEPMTLSTGTIQAKGGFVLRKGQMELNSTLEVMIGDVTEAMTPEVVQILFRNEAPTAASN